MTTIIDSSTNGIINGSGEQDLFIAMGGNDTYTGGAGDDRYVFGKLSGHDVITDYAPGDMIFFNGPFASQAALDAAVTIENGSTVIRWTTGGVSNSLTLQGFTGSASLAWIDQSSVASGRGSTQYGSARDDTMYGGRGADILWGVSADSDSIYANGDDLFFGGAGDDQIYTNENGASVAFGGAGSDRIRIEGYAFGEAGDDRLTGRSGPDYLYGGDGNDYLNGLYYMNGGNGDDTISYSRHYTDNSQPYAILGGAGYDVLIAASSLNRVDIRGVEEIRASSSLVLLDGAGEAGGVLLIQGASVDASAETDARLIVTGGSAIGGAMGDELTGRDGASTLEGRNGDDILYGAGGADTLTGGAGDDVVLGGAGRDVAIFAGRFGDYVIEQQPDGAVVVTGAEGRDV